MPRTKKAEEVEEKKQDGELPPASKFEPPSGYEEFDSLPKRVWAKKLTESMTIKINKNGLEGELTAGPGDWHVIKPLKDGTQKEWLYSSDEFNDKFNVQRELEFD